MSTLKRAPMRKFHRVLGWLLCLPLLIWASTAFVFLVKPSYSGAYHQLAVKTYALSKDDFNSLQFLNASNAEWASLKLVRTTLGLHALKTRSMSAYPRASDLTSLAVQLHWMYAPDAKQWLAKSEIDRSSAEALLQDAQTLWPQRYGSSGAWVSDEQGNETYRTNTQIDMQLHWSTLGISQSGADTQWINRAYRWHYLQWTGIDAIDRVLGVLGLVLLLAMTAVGAWLLRRA